jgi:hypothetical protein
MDAETGTFERNLDPAACRDRFRAALANAALTA